MKRVIIQYLYNVLGTCDIWIKQWLTNRGEQDRIFLSFCLFVLSWREVLSAHSHKKTPCYPWSDKAVTDNSKISRLAVKNGFYWRMKIQNYYECGIVVCLQGEKTWINRWALQLAVKENTQQRLPLVRTAGEWFLRTSLFTKSQTSVLWCSRVKCSACWGTNQCSKSASIDYMSVEPKSNIVLFF